MATDAPQYPILIDTDALIATANSSLWDLITEHVGLTTTNVCQQELKRHREQTSSHAPEGSRPYRLHHGSRRVLDALENQKTPLTRVVSVPRPHGADAGEQALEQHLVQYPEAVDYVVLMDAHGRRSMRREIQNRDLEARVVPPTFLFYLLYDTDLIARRGSVKRALHSLKVRDGPAITLLLRRGKGFRLIVPTSSIRSSDRLHETGNGFQNGTLMGRLRSATSGMSSSGLRHQYLSRSIPNWAVQRSPGDRSGDAILIPSPSKQMVKDHINR